MTRENAKGVWVMVGVIRVGCGGAGGDQGGAGWGVGDLGGLGRDGVGWGGVIRQ